MDQSRGELVPFDGLGFFKMLLFFVSMETSLTLTQMGVWFVSGVELENYWRFFHET